MRYRAAQSPTDINNAQQEFMETITLPISEQELGRRLSYIMKWFMVSGFCFGLATGLFIMLLHEALR